MKVAIITVAGVSSRFNKGVPENEKELKAIYTESGQNNTLLYHLLRECKFAERIVIVGGYKFDCLKAYCAELESTISDRICLVFNEHYKDLASGYSLFLGLQEAFKYNPDEILFVEGDLAIDSRSFDRVINSSKSVLSFTFEPIYANKAVVLYKDDTNCYRYAFNSSHGLLSINTPFSCIFNSGQIWKFTEMEVLRRANERFYIETRNDTNLRIIQNYLDAGIEVSLIGIEQWTNCNTKADYKKIVSYWKKNM